MECFSAILLFDAFSARKMERFRHWTIVTSLAFLEATFLNIASNVLPAYSKILIALVLYYFVYRILYISNRFFGLYISIIIYATMCCIDNLWHTLALLLSETLNGVFLGNALCQSMLVHGVIIAVCFLQAKARNGKLSQATNFRWYTIPAVLSLASVLLIFFFGSCFQQGQISIQPLCVCATFITVMQIAALLLISWMEQNANFREEAISLQAKSKAQQESIEALSAAYAQQRKLTHDFRAHLSTLDGMLMQQNIDIQSELIEESQRDWMAYSLQRKFMNFGGFFILVCFGALVAPLPQVILLNFGLAFLREKTNGLHMPTVFSCFLTSLFCEYACLYLIDRLQSSTIAATIMLLIVSVTLILTLAPCNNSAIHCSNEELQDMKIAVRKRLVLYCLIIPALLLLKPLYSIVWIVAAAADALLLVLAKIGVGIK